MVTPWSQKVHQRLIILWYSLNSPIPQKCPLSWTDEQRLTLVNKTYPGGSIPPSSTVFPLVNRGEHDVVITD